LQDVVEPLDEEYPDAVRVYVRVIGRQGLVNERVELRGHLNPRRPTADNHEGELGLRDLLSHQGDLLEALDDPVADALGVFDASHV